MTKSELNHPIPFHQFGGKGAILHFAHANGYPPRCYQQFMAPFLDHYQVLGLKQRPLWPNSQIDQARNWSQFADDLIAFFDQQGLQNIIGMGHSLGAIATLYAAIKRPDLFSALVLVEPVLLDPFYIFLGNLMPLALRKRLNPMVKIALKRRDTWDSKQALFDSYRQKRTFQGFADESLWDFVHHGTTLMQGGQVRLAYPKIWEAHVYSTPPKIWRPLKQVTQPVIGIRGERSDTLSPTSWARWQRYRPETTFMEIPQSGHLVPFERPDFLAEQILASLASIHS